MAASTPVRSFPILQKNRVALFASAASVMVCSSTAGKLRPQSCLRQRSSLMFWKGTASKLGDPASHKQIKWLRFSSAVAQQAVSQMLYIVSQQSMQVQAQAHTATSLLAQSRLCSCLDFRRETVLTSRAYLISIPAAWQHWVRQTEPASSCTTAGSIRCVRTRRQCRLIVCCCQLGLPCCTDGRPGQQ